MQRIHVHELTAHTGTRVLLAGWLHHRRQLSRLTFLLLRDRTGIAQVVVEQPDLLAEIAALHPETVLEVEGLVGRAPQTSAGVEVREPVIRVLSPAAGPPPVDLRPAGIKEQLRTQLDHAAVSLRHPRRRAAFELAAASVAGFRGTLDALDFVEIQTPKIVGSATESGANVFEVDYFGRGAYLAQSPQLYKQMLVGVFERVYETAPAFRAEPHDTPRHLAEFVSLDVELGFIRDHFDVMAVAREAVAGMVAGIRERAASAADALELVLPEVPDVIPHVHFHDAQQLIERATGDRVVGEPDLAPAHERWLGEWARREHRSELLFVVGYPMTKRPFYTYPDPSRPGFSNSFDLLFRGLELMTGGQRLHRYDDYTAALAAKGDDPEPYESYLEAFRHGMPPHGGFAIGLERWVARLVEAANVRETTLFPRDLNRLVP